jgi:hypothetical protein
MLPIIAIAGTLLWLATVPWFDHAPFLLRLVIAMIIVAVTVAGMVMVRPGRSQP